MIVLPTLLSHSLHSQTSNLNSYRNFEEAMEDKGVCFVIPYIEGKAPKLKWNLHRHWCWKRGGSNITLQAVLEALVTWAGETRKHKSIYTQCKIPLANVAKQQLH